MKIPLGIDANTLKDAQPKWVEWDISTVINGHMLFVGDSGAGKSYQVRRFVKGLSRAAPSVRFHVFDVHGDLSIDGESMVNFSEGSEYGINPLEVNPHRYYGGVRKAIGRFIRALNRSTHALGARQEAVLRYLLEDLYARQGFKIADPGTWGIGAGDQPAALDTPDRRGRKYLDVAYDDRYEAKSLGCQFDDEPSIKSWWVPEERYSGALLRWEPKVFGKKHPTIADAVRYGRRRMEALYLGANTETMRKLATVNKLSGKYRKLVEAAIRSGKEPSAPGEDLLKAQDSTTEAFADYIRSIRTGKELAVQMRYDSVDILRSVVDRLENLAAIGIFRNTRPAFHEERGIWRYEIRWLDAAEQTLFVYFRLEEIFRDAIMQGPVERGELRHVIVLDEAQRYFEDDPDNVLNRIVTEMRKFGVALICASQSPTHFSEDFLTQVGFKMILSMDRGFWSRVTQRFGVSREWLEFLSPEKTCLVQIKERNKPSSVFTPVVLANDNQ